MKTTKTKAFCAAQKEGLRYYWANTHVGGRYTFVGTSWEDGGFVVDSHGKPVADAARNTVARYGVEQLDPECAAHVAQCEEWYG